MSPGTRYVHFCSGACFSLAVQRLHCFLVVLLAVSPSLSFSTSLPFVLPPETSVLSPWSSVILLKKNFFLIICF